MHVDTVYRWKWDGPGSGVGKPKKIKGAVAETLTVLTHDMLRHVSCVSFEIMLALFQDLCKKDGLKVKLSLEWVRTFLISIDMSCQAAAQRSGPEVWTLPDKVLLTRRFIMKIAFVLDEWGLDWTKTYNFDETCLSLSLTGSHGWWWKGKNQKPQFQKPTKQAVTVTLVTSAVRAQVAAQCTFHGTTERVVPDLTTDDLLSQSLDVHGYSAAAALKDGGHGECAYSCVGFCCAHGHGACPHQCQDQRVSCSLAMCPFKSTIRRTACETYAKNIHNDTDKIGNVQPTTVPDLRANLVRLIETAVEHDNRFEFARKHVRSYDGVWD